MVLVADLDGRVTVSANARAAAPATPVTLMQALSADSVLVLGAEPSRATLFYPDLGTAFDLRGPGNFHVTPSEVRALGTARAPSARQLNRAFRGIRLERANLTPASVVMRSAEATDLPSLIRPQGVVLDTGEVVFSWAAPGERQEYRFRLMTRAGDLLYETLTPATQVALPHGLQLRVGEWYLWGVQPVREGRRGLAQWREFLLAGEDVRKLALELDRDGGPGSAAERNLRDLLLAQQAQRSTGAR